MAFAIIRVFEGEVVDISPTIRYIERITASSIVRLLETDGNGIGENELHIVEVVDELPVVTAKFQ